MKWRFEHHESGGEIGAGEYVPILRDNNLVSRFARKQDELRGLNEEDIFVQGDSLDKKKAVIIGYIEMAGSMSYCAGLRTDEKNIKHAHFSVPHGNPFEIEEDDLKACLQNPDEIAYKCIMDKKIKLSGTW